MAMIFGVVDPRYLGEGAETVLRHAGIAGACVYLANYSMLQLKVIDGNSILFTAINMIAATLVLAGLTFDFNPGAAIIQTAWLFLGAIGISITTLKRRAALRDTQTIDSKGPPEPAPDAPPKWKLPRPYHPTVI